MKVLQLIAHPQRRGAEIFALDLARALDERGCATRVVSLYAPANDDTTGARLELRSGDCALNAAATSLLERAPGWQPSLLRRLRHLLAESAPDVVQVNGSRTVKYGSLLRRLDQRSDWALVYRSIGTPSDWLRGRMRRLLYRSLVVSSMDGIVAVSEGTRRDLESVYEPRVPTTVIPRGLDVFDFRPRESRHEIRSRIGAPADALVTIVLGSLTIEKRIDRAIRVATAAARMLPNDASPELWVVGAGPLRNELVRLVEGSSPRLVVRFPGTTDDAAGWLAAADLLLLSSDSEGTPGVLLEAGAVELPVVATQVGGVAELVEDGTTGYTFPPSDEAAMAGAVARLLAEPEWRRRMGAAARRRVEQRYDLGAIAERYLEHYERVIAARRSGRAAPYGVRP